jgi:hypothetical protein
MPRACPQTEERAEAWRKLLAMVERESAALVEEAHSHWIVVATIRKECGFRAALFSSSILAALR